MRLEVDWVDTRWEPTPETKIVTYAPTWGRAVVQKAHPRFCQVSFGFHDSHVFKEFILLVYWHSLLLYF